jgi:predicted nucleic acid-binding Zn finger protein
MSDPILALKSGFPFDDWMRKRIIAYYKSRGKKALDICEQGRVKRYRDFFVVVGTTGEYVVEDEFCSCDDFLHRGGNCAHIIAVKIARATGRFELIDLWYYEDLNTGSDGTAL